MPAAGAELRSLTVIACVWLVPWVLLTCATWLAGGAPRSSPVDFVDPADVVHRLRAGANAATPWRFVDAGRAVDRLVFWSALACAALALGWALTGFSARRRLPASSRWATWWDMRGLRSWRARRGRFALGRRGGRLIVTERETSVLVVGPTRSGKTSAIVVPNLFDWTGPAVVTSTKSELVDVTGAHRQSLGPVYVYDPTGESRSSYRSITWSPIAGCTTLDRAWAVAAWLCAPLQQGGGRGDNDWMHWAESGKLLIAPLLFAAANTGHTVVDVCAWLHGFDLGVPSQLIEAMLDASDDDDPADAERALAMLAAVDQRPERERGTVFSTVMRIFSAFNERTVARSASSSRFDPEELIERGGTLYLCTPRQAPERIASLFVGILMTVVTSAYALAARRPRGRLKNDLGLFLDELANVVPIDDLPALASQGAGRGVLLMSIVQDLSQLRYRYGSDRANSIVNNHGCKVILPGISDPESAETLSKLVGQSVVTDIQVSRSDTGTVTRAYSRRRELIAGPDALRRLPADAAIVLHRSSAPAVVSLRPWYRSRRLRALARTRFFKSADYAGRKS